MFSKCANPECKAQNSFELVDARVQGARYKKHFIQCSRCGMVVSATGRLDAGIMADENGKKLDTLSQAVAQLQSQLSGLQETVNRLGR